VVGTVLSLAGLAAAGRVDGWHAALAAILLPALGIGLLASGPLSRRMDRRWLRPAVLGFAFAAGVAALIEGLVERA
jgi:uncharacterized membrane protein YfcA